MSYPVKFHLSYNEFINTVKDMKTCSAFFVAEGYKKITPEMLVSLQARELVITEYHDEPLGEAIYVSPAASFQ